MDEIIVICSKMKFTGEKPNIGDDIIISYDGNAVRATGHPYAQGFRDDDISDLKEDEIFVRFLHPELVKVI